LTAVAPSAQPGQAADGPAPDWRRPFLLQLIIAVLVTIGVQATRPMVTYRAIALGAGPFEIGLVQSSFSLVPALTAVALGRWVDRIGEARFLVVAMALVSVGSLVLLGDSLLALALGLMVMGFGQVVNLVAGQSMVANRGPRDRREDRFGWYSTAVSIGQLAGPTIGALIVGGAAGAAVVSAANAQSASANAEAPVFVFGAVLAAIACGLALFLPHRRPRAAEEPQERGPNLLGAAYRVLKRPGMSAAMLVSITVISAIDVFVAYLPAYGDINGLSVETVGALLSVRAGSTLVSRVFMGRLIELMGREWLLASSMLMAGVAIGALPFVTSVPVLFGLMILIGLGLGLGQPMTIAWVANRSPRAERGLALGVRLTGNRASLLVVPTLMGAIAGASGIAAIWLVLAASLGFGALIARRTPFDELAAEGPVREPVQAPKPDEAT
jgi:MFS family permease